MPNLAFSPGPLNPSQQEHGGEKENNASEGRMSSGGGGGGGINKKIAGEIPAAGRSSAGSTGRSPLAAMAPTGGGAGAVVCKRDSSCKCPDCDMAASVFGIDELRQVGSSGGGRVPNSPDPAAASGGGGGLARSPLPGTSSGIEDTVPASPVAAVAAADAVDESQEEAVAAAPADDSQTIENQQAVAATAAVEEPPSTVVAPSPAPAAAAAPSSPPAAGSAVSGEMPSKAEEAALAPRSSAAGGDDSGAVVDEQQQSGQDATGELKPAPAAEPLPTGGSTPAAAAHGSTAAVAEGGGGGSSKKKAGWGFRMARAVFSPLSPKKEKQVVLGGGGGNGDGGETGAAATMAAFAGKLEHEAAASASAAPQQPTMVTATATAEPSGEGELPTPPSGAGATGDNASGSKAGEAVAGFGGEDDLLSDEDEDEDDGENVTANGGGAGEEEHGPLEQEEGDAAAAAVSGGTCKPPLPPPGDGGEGGGCLAEKAAAAGGAGAGARLAGVLGKGAASKRSSSGRRLSKDVFFECSSEVDHVLASDSESDFDDGNERRPGKQELPPSAEDGNHNNGDGSVPAQAPLTTAASAPAAAGGTHSRRTSASSPISLLPVVEANSPAAALEAAVAAAATAGVEAGAAKVAGGSAAAEEGTTVVAGAAPAEPSNGAAPAAEVTPHADGGLASQDDSQAQGGGARGFLGLGRRRNRRQAPQLELGMADAYGHEDDRAKFSQAEVDAKIKERLSEEKAAFEKTMSAIKAAHEAELQAAAEKLQQSSSDGNRAKIAARDAEALEREIAMLSERYGEAAAEAKSTGKKLREKEALLDACTAQLMGLKTELAAAKAEHAAEKQAMKETADAERRGRSLAEGSLQQLEMAYNKLEDSEREKRAAGILKMKHDMQALARAQFAEANKQHAALKAKLECSEAQTRLLGEAAKEKDSQTKTAVRKADELQSQVEAMRKAQADSAADASRKENLLREEASALREEAESRLDEMEAMARERDSANNGRDVSQDALARMAIRNTQMKESVADLESKVKELEGFCTEALDELDAEKAKNAKLLLAVAGQ